MGIFFLILFVALVIIILYGLGTRSKPVKIDQLPLSYKMLLQQHVAFYRALTPPDKTHFEERMAGFLSSIKIEGIKTEVEDIDRVLIAASAIIPIFAFKGWSYTNLTNVLLYPEHFNQEFDMRGYEKPIMGMVGEGHMNYQMVLSKPALHEGFKNETDKNNTAIHEFVHLVDKMDGVVDGIPEILLQKQYTIPWINLMHQEIDNILKDRSDINPYGATNKGEFFAVASEYFFSQPELFQQNHPELFALMKNIFDQHPKVLTH